MCNGENVRVEELIFHSYCHTGNAIQFVASKSVGIIFALFPARVVAQL